MKLVLGIIVTVMILITYHIIQEYTDIITEANIATLDMFAYTAVYIMIAMVCSNLLMMLVNTSIGMFSWIPERLAPLGEAVAKYVVWLIALTMIAPLWGTTAEYIIGGLGIVAVGIAFGAQTTIQNLFGFGKIVGTNPFEEGDRITVGSITGVVKEIYPFDTLIDTDDGDLVTVPNSLFSTEPITKINKTSELKFETPGIPSGKFTTGFVQAGPFVQQEPRVVKSSGVNSDYISPTQDKTDYITHDVVESDESPSEVEADTENTFTATIKGVNASGTIIDVGNGNLVTIPNSVLPTGNDAKG